MEILLTLNEFKVIEKYCTLPPKKSLKSELIVKRKCM